MPSVDLNLLTTLDALLQEGSVTGAARRLHLTPPGVSRNLARLREITGDPLLVKVGRRLMPTPVAEELRERAHAVLEDVHGILSPRVEMSDAQIEHSLERTFTIQAGSDTHELFGPAIVSLVRERAAGARVRFLGDGPLADDSLALGKVDVFVGSPLPAECGEVLRQRLMSDRMVLVGHRDGVLSSVAQEASPRVHDVTAVPHIAVSRRGVLHGAFDEALSQRGLSRTVIASTPGFSSAFTFLRSGDYLCLAPEGLTRPLLGSELITRPAPVDLPRVYIEMAWHRRTDTHPEHRWLRERVRQAAHSTCSRKQRLVDAGPAGHAAGVPEVA